MSSLQKCVAGLLVLVFFISSNLFSEGTSLSPVSIEDLITHANQVALVEIVSGDGESYDMPAYEARVVRSIKGTERGVIYFGKYLGLAVGAQYIVFLSNTKSISPSGKSSGLRYGQIGKVYDMDSSLPVEYRCMFDGKEIANQCDYGVRVESSVVLPNYLRTFSTCKEESVDSKEKWVRKDVLVSFLENRITPRELPK